MSLVLRPRCLEVIFIRRQHNQFIRPTEHINPTRNFTGLAPVFCTCRRHSFFNISINIPVGKEKGKTCKKINQLFNLFFAKRKGDRPLEERRFIVLGSSKHVGVCSCSSWPVQQLCWRSCPGCLISRAAGFLLSFCAAPGAQHLLRTVPRRSAAAHEEDAVWDKPCMLGGLGEDARPARDLDFLPAQLGSLGLTWAQCVAPDAYWAAGAMPCQSSTNVAPGVHEATQRTPGATDCEPGGGFEGDDHGIDDNRTRVCIERQKTNCTPRQKLQGKSRTKQPVVKKMQFSERKRSVSGNMLTRSNIQLETIKGAGDEIVHKDLPSSWPKYPAEKKPWGR